MAVSWNYLELETYCSSPRQIHLHTRLCDYISDISGYISARSCIGTQTAGKLFIISIVISQLHNYLTGHHGLVAALLIALVPAVKVAVADVLPGYPEASRGVLRRAGRPALVVCLVLLAVI